MVSTELPSFQIHFNLSPSTDHFRPALSAGAPSYFCTVQVPFGRKVMIFLSNHEPSMSRELAVWLTVLFCSCPCENEQTESNAIAQMARRAWKRRQWFKMFIWILFYGVMIPRSGLKELPAALTARILILNNVWRRKLNPATFMVPVRATLMRFRAGIQVVQVPSTFSFGASPVSCASERC